MHGRKLILKYEIYDLYESNLVKVHHNRLKICVDKYSTQKQLGETRTNKLNHTTRDYIKKMLKMEIQTFYIRISGQFSSLSLYQGWTTWQFKINIWFQLLCIYCM